MLSRSDVDLPVRKSPVQRLIHRAAQDYGLLYGIAAALIALLAGWLAAVVFNQRWRPCRRRTTSARCRRPPGGWRPWRSARARRPRKQITAAPSSAAPKRPAGICAAIQASREA